MQYREERNDSKIYKEAYVGGGSAIGWKTVTTYVDSGSEISVNLPDDATYCYASITDNHGDIISTKFMKVQ